MSQPSAPPSPLRTALAACLALVLGGALWLPAFHLLFRSSLPRDDGSPGLPPSTRALVKSQTALWSAPRARARETRILRSRNPEWDFMGRTFLVLSLANLCLRDPAGKAGYLRLMDQVLDETMRLERRNGVDYFLMGYAREGRFVATPPRSLFQDGEIALMMAARRFVAEDEDLKPLLAQRVGILQAQMEQSPVLCGESYPDECWMFCNSVAVAALRMADILDGTDHSAFIHRWLKTVKTRLTDPRTGLPFSSFTFEGIPIQGPEGSTLWMVAHSLQVVDPAYARSLYRRARKELAGSFLGFGYAREWPRSWPGPMDVDSGPTIPVLGASVGSSGLAILGAASFGDREYLASLLTTLRFAGFPVEEKRSLRYAAGNQVGDAVVLYGLTQGPLWREVTRRAAGGRS